MSNLQTVVDQILDARNSIPSQRSVLTAITGIDGCGKGYITARIVNAVQAKGVRATGINIDGWFNLPDRRFNASNPAENFYDHAIRFEEMFAQLIFPLRDRRSLRIEADYAEETATEYRRHTYEFDEIDVIVLEGIYLLKRVFQTYYDLSYWIECSFDTALDRVITRAQEGLPPAETIRAYRTIYFPAQQIHFKRDNPKAAATMMLNNDPKLGPVC
jgi:uridine kinase